MPNPWICVIIRITKAVGQQKLINITYVIAILSPKIPIIQREYIIQNTANGIIKFLNNTILATYHFVKHPSRSERMIRFAPKDICAITTPPKLILIQESTTTYNVKFLL